VFLSILSLAISAALSTITFLGYHNTLGNNHRWIATKSQIEKGVMGRKALVTTRQLFAKEQLNLGSWHGFQEIFYHESVPLSEVSFDFELDPEAYLAFIFSKAEQGSSGIRISKHRDFNNIVFQVTNSGEFTKKQILSRLKIEDGQQYHLKAVYEYDGVVIKLDDKVVGKFEGTITGRQKFGFRGGYHNSVVDNIRIKTATGEVIEELFTGREGFLQTFIAFTTGFFFFQFSFFLIFIKSKKVERRQVFFTIIGLNFVVIVSVFLVLFYLRLTADQYPKVTGVLEKKKIEIRARRVASTVHYVAAEYEPKASQNTRRLFFVGSSQTWGAGATHEGETFVRVIEEKLNNNDELPIRFECINGGISSAESSNVIQVLREQWYQYDMSLLIINLSSNDRDVDIFQKSIQAIVEMSLNKGIKPVLVLEPNSIEFPEIHLPPKHQVMREIGKEFDVPVIEMHDYLSRHYDDGFLWWDFVHMTSFGQKLFAEYLLQELQPLLDEVTVIPKL